jgi:hypothetical protein
VQHIHVYVSRIPGAKVNSSEGRPEHEAFRLSQVPANSVRDWLRRPASAITATLETVDAACAWHADWIEETPRPDSSWGLSEGPEEGKRKKVEFTGRITGWDEVIDGFYTAGGEYVSATFILCPPRVIPGCPAPPPCPLGRTS